MPAKDVRAVIEHYRKYHPRSRYSDSSQAWRKVEMRLEEGYSVEELCLAIDGCHRSPFHCGENRDGKRFQSLELICRHSDKVNGFIELAEAPTTRVTQRNRANVRTLAEWAQRKQDKTDDTW